MTTTLTNSVKFTSNDYNIVAIDNTGKVMGLNLGTAVVTAELTHNKGVKDIINVNVVDSITHDYSITITANGQLKTIGTVTYIAHIYDNGVEVTDQSVEWTVKNIDNTTNPYALITSFTGNACTLKSSNSSNVCKVIRLTAKLNNANPIIIGSFDITIKSAF